MTGNRTPARMVMTVFLFLSFDTFERLLVGESNPSTHGDDGCILLIFNEIEDSTSGGN